MNFEWNPEKALTNLNKHGVSFQEAATVFNDPLSMTFPDPDHSIDESRYITMGTSSLGLLLVVVDPDVAQAFPTDESVNDALRMLMQVAQRQNEANKASE